MTTIYLHIGTNKTATTTIQAFSAINRLTLEKLGIFYPFTGTFEKGCAHYKLSQAFDFTMKKIENASRTINELKTEFKDELNKHKPQKVLISSESFVLVENGNMEKFAEFIKNWQVKIIVYLRRHDYWLESLYAQAMKTSLSAGPFPEGIDSYIEFHKRNTYLNYKNLIEKWMEICGKENIIIRPFEEQQNQPNIIIDFFNQIGTNTAHPIFRDLSQYYRNKKKSPYVTCLFDYIIRKSISNEKKAVLKAYAIELASNYHFHSHILSPAKRKKIIFDNINDYEYIAKNYLKRANGKLFYEDLPNENEPWFSLDQNEVKKLKYLVDKKIEDIVSSE